MKPNLFTLTLTAIFVALVSFIFTFQVFSYSNAPTAPVDQNPSITLIFPDQSYVISVRDLATLKSELVIPTQERTTPKISYNQSRGVLESLTSPQDYVVDITKLRQTIELYGLDSDISFTPIYTLRDRYTTSLSDFNARLSNIYQTPLNITLKDGSSFTDFALDPYLLRSIITPITTDLNSPLEINQSALIAYLTSHLTPKQKKYFNSASAYQNTKNAINLRFMGEDTPVVLGVDDGPSSGGDLADRYLEIDLSQQKMYFFINQALFKEYHVSTGAEYPTPVGEYHILNKEPKAYSTIYNVWMPYWMGFTYARDVGAYLGIHEIAYAVNEKGKPFYKHGYYIGDMMTGGCVAMEPKDSREIYNLSEVGMLVRIVP